jgi:anhydro-N-acetylmuramic acid kinase
MLFKINKFLSIGTMSGSSLDGLDIVAVEFACIDAVWESKIIAAECLKYSNEWHENLKNARNLSAFDLLKLNIKYGHLNADYIQKFINKNNLNQVDLVVSHGHTVYHQPTNGFTLQIGDGQTMSVMLNLPVVCNLRAKDITLGGQGAPIVPIADLLIYSKFTACLNIGGIANISFKNRNNKQIIAFDICAANQVLNYLSNQLGLPYDNNGTIAKSGGFITKVYESFINLDFHTIHPPKSLANEWIYNNIIQKIDLSLYKIEDLLHTFTLAIAYTIAESINEYCNKGDDVLVTGGGAYNSFLIYTIQTKIDASLVVPDEQTINYKEAIAMALIGVLRWYNLPNVLSDVTGSSCDNSSGEIYYPK